MVAPRELDTHPLRHDQYFFASYATVCKWLKRCSSHVPVWFLFKVDPSTQFYELKIDVVKARQYLFSAINKQLTYILKNFWPTMPLGSVVSIKKQVFVLATAFSLCFCTETRGVLLVFASCVGTLRGQRGAWKWRSAENRGTARRIGVSHLY